jgi:Zn-dependent protease with chaperone function
VQICAVLAHEIGHWKMWHTKYNLVIGILSQSAMLFAFSWLAAK